MTDRDALIARLRKLAAMANPEEEWQAEIGWTCAEAADALAAPPPAPPADLVALVREYQESELALRLNNPEEERESKWKRHNAAIAALLAYPLPAAPPVVEPVQIPEPHQRAAATFRALATPVPMSEAERTADDPDYGLTPAAPPQEDQ